MVTVQGMAPRTEQAPCFAIPENSEWDDSQAVANITVAPLSPRDCRTPSPRGLEDIRPT